MVNTNNTPNPDDSVNENNEIFAKKEQNRDRFLMDFTKDYYSWTEKNNRLDDLFIADDFKDSPELKKEIKEFYERSDGKYWEIDLKKDIGVISLRYSLNIKYTKLLYKRQNLKELILEDFDLTKKTDLKKIDDFINKLDDKTLDLLLDKREKREKEIKNILPDIKKRELLIVKFLTKFDIFNISIEKYEKLSPTKKEAIRAFVGENGELKQVDKYAIEKLFDSWLVTLFQKKKIIAFCYPMMTISELRFFGFVWVDFDFFLEREKVKILEETLKGIKWKGYDEKDKEEFEKKIKKDIDGYINQNDLKVMTADFLEKLDSTNLQKIIDKKYFEDFARELNEEVDTIDEEQNRENNPDWVESFEKDLKNQKNVGWDVEEGSNLDWKVEKGLYIELELRETGVSNSITKCYYRIGSLSDTHIELVDLWSPWIDKNKDNTPDSKKINMSFDLFKQRLKWLNIAWKKFNVPKCLFMDEKTVDRKIVNGEIERAYSKKTDIEVKRVEDSSSYSRKKEVLEDEKQELENKLEQFAKKDSRIVKYEENIIFLKFQLENNPDLNDQEKIDLQNSIQNLEWEKIFLLLKIKDDLSNYFADNNAIPSTLNLSPDEKEELNNLNEDIAWKSDEIFDVDDEIKNLEIFDKDAVKDVLDEVDSDGKSFWFDVWLSFITKDKDIYIVKNITGNNVLIHSPFWFDKEVSLEVFVEAFKTWECKRHACENSGENIVDGIKNDNTIDSKLLDFWKDVKFENDGIVKEKNNKTIELDYLQSTNSNSKELIKIDSISWDKAIVSFWESEKDEKTDKVKGITMFSNESWIEVSLSWLKAWIKTEKSKPVNLNWEDEDELPESKKRKWKLWTRFMNWYSISEIIWAGKMFVNNMEEYLKQWSEEHSARLLNNSLLKNLLPYEVQAEIESKVEESQKKLSQVMFDKLSILDSWPATKLIARWLKDKNTPQYKLEAGVQFMFSKYGVLYWKGWLHEYKGSFLWYEALWWKIWDEIYTREEQKAKKEWTVFTEENVVISLLFKQSSEKHNWIKRRSKFGKDMAIASSKWKKEDAESAVLEVQNQTTIKERVDWAIGELEKWNYPNAMWRLPEILNKWGSMEMLNKVPFVMIFSGEAYTYQGSSLKELAEYPYASKMLPMLNFAIKDQKKDWLKLLNTTILEICRRLGQIRGDNSIFEDAEEIFKNQESSSLWTMRKIQETSAFYDRHWKILTDILYGLNTWKTDPNSYLSKMILMEKDEYEDENWNIIKWNATFKNYHDFLSEASQDYHWDKNPELMTEAFSKAWTSWINNQRAARDLLGWNRNWAFNKKDEWPKMWEEFVEEIEAIKQRSYWPYWDKWKRKDMQQILKWLLAGLFEGTDAKMLTLNTNVAWSQFKKWWIDLNKLISLGYTYIDIEKWETDNIIKGFLDNIINWSSLNNDWMFTNWVEQTVNQTIHAANDTMYNNQDKAS